MRTFVVSDTHFGHAGVCNFLRDDGTKLRPWHHPGEMDRDMVAWWNATVSEGDKVYHLGDVVINRQCLQIMQNLNGTKVLIKGNHDIFKPNEYLDYFKDIRAYHVLDGYILSHIPIHPDSMSRFKGNIHGHLHANNVMSSPHHPDKRYQCVCVEQTNYKPILFDEVKSKFVL